MILLFDIDGTLVADNGLDAEFYRAAVHEVLGADVSIHEDWSRYVNVTDDGILREIAEQHQIRYEDCADEVRSAFERRVAQNSSSWREVPGAVELFSALQQREDVSVGIATGGWRTTIEQHLFCKYERVQDQRDSMVR